VSIAHFLPEREEFANPKQVANFYQE